MKEKKTQTSSEYNVAIIGSGVAGMSMSLYLSRAGVDNIIIESSAPGGQLNKIINIENYPGVPSIDGPTFAYNLYTQVNELKVKYLSDEVINIKKGKTFNKIITKNNIIKAKYIIIATGRSPRQLLLKNASKLLGNGISYCALCDGAFYKNKNVAVLGGSRSALEEALYLSAICKKVTIIHRKDHFTAESLMINKVLAKDNIEIKYNSTIVKLNSSNGKLKSIVINNNEEIIVEGLFVCIGYIPNTKFIDTVKKEDNYIIVNKNYETSNKKIYAIGDVIKKDLYQITSATNDALTLSNYLINKVM